MQRTLPFFGFIFLISISASISFSSPPDKDGDSNTDDKKKTYPIAPPPNYTAELSGTADDTRETASEATAISSTNPVGRQNYHHNSDSVTDETINPETKVNVIYDMLMERAITDGFFLEKKCIEPPSEGEKSQLFFNLLSNKEEEANPFVTKKELSDWISQSAEFHRKKLHVLTCILNHLDQGKATTTQQGLVNALIPPPKHNQQILEIQYNTMGKLHEKDNDAGGDAHKKNKEEEEEEKAQRRKEYIAWSALMDERAKAKKDGRRTSLKEVPQIGNSESHPPSFPDDIGQSTKS